MATTLPADPLATETGRRLGVIRLLVTGGGTAAAVFLLCWLGTFIPFGSPTHAYIRLFTPAAVDSVGALREGLVWSLLFGALVGGLFAAVYNLFAGLDRR